MSVNPILLIVEDDKTQQKVLSLLAEKYGFEVVIAETGKKALLSLADADADFDAVLMDIRMPDMDGYECTQAIRMKEIGLPRRMPIIAITAYASDAYRAKCLEAGMDDYLSKPFDAEDFRKLLLKWAYNPKKPNLKLLPNTSKEEAI